MELGEIYRPIEADLREVEEELRRQLQSDNGFIAQVNNYILSSRGKRIRPALVFFSVRVGQKELDQVFSTSTRLATALELIHTATLIHDDIVDDANLRRHQETINSKWGNEISVLLGDYLYSKAFSLLSQLGAPEILQRISLATNEVCEGEITQIRTRFQFDLTEKDYLKIIRQKTASLMSACCETGAMLGGAKSQEVEALSHYGLNLGTAFQLLDDCQDLTGEEWKSGKTLRSDFHKGKLTLPLIYFLDTLSAQQKDEFVHLVYLQDSDAIQKRLPESGAIEQVVKKARKYLECAKTEIRILQDSAVKDSLCNLCDYLAEKAI